MIAPARRPTVPTSDEGSQCSANARSTPSRPPAAITSSAPPGMTSSAGWKTSRTRPGSDAAAVRGRRSTARRRAPRPCARRGRRRGRRPGPSTRTRGRSRPSSGSASRSARRSHDRIRSRADVGRPGPVPGRSCGRQAGALEPLGDPGGGAHLVRDPSRGARGGRAGTRRSRRRTARAAGSDRRRRSRDFQVNLGPGLLWLRLATTPC